MQRQSATVQSVLVGWQEREAAHLAEMGLPSQQQEKQHGTTALLAGFEKVVVAHINTCFQQQQHALQHIIAVEQDDALQKFLAVQQHMQANVQEQQNGLQEWLTQVMAAQNKIIDNITLCAQQQQQKQSGVPTNRGEARVPLNPTVTLTIPHNQPPGANSMQQETLPSVKKVNSKEALKQTRFNSDTSVDTSLGLQTPLLVEDADPESAMPEYCSQGSNLVRKDSNTASKIKALGRRGSTTRMATLFPQTEDLKDSVADSLRQHLYSVEDLYHKTGMWQAVACSEYFHYVMTIVVALNTIWIAVETDYNKEELLCNATLMFQVCDNLFCFTFCFEMLVRFMAFRHKLDAFMDRWFLFDGSLVLLMIWETWIVVAIYLTFGLSTNNDAAKNSQALRMLRLIRLVRVARTTRLLNAVPELLILARGMVAGVRSVLAVLSLLGLLIYVYAVMFTMTLSGTEVGAGIFDDVPQSMNSLLLAVLCGPEAELMYKLLAAGWPYYLAYLTFLLVATLTLMNMLIGILCDVVSNVAEEAKEEMMVKEVKKHVTRLASTLDSDGDGVLSAEEFEAIIKDPDLTEAFSEMGVDVVGFAYFAKFLYEQCDELTFNDFGVLACQFQGRKPASVQDVMDMRRYVTMELLCLESHLVAHQDTAGQIHLAVAGIHEKVHE